MEVIILVSQQDCKPHGNRRPNEKKMVVTTIGDKNLQMTKVIQLTRDLPFLGGLKCKQPGPAGVM